VHKIINLQSCGSSNFETPKLGIPGQNEIWVLAPWLDIENNLRCWFSPSSGHDESCESVFAGGPFMHQKCSNDTLTNLLFGLCKSV